MSRTAASGESIQRAQSDQCRSAYVCKGGHHHTASLHVLRSHRDKGTRQERPALQVRLPGRRALDQRRVYRERGDARGQSDPKELVRSQQAHLSRLTLGGLRSRKEMGQAIHYQGLQVLAGFSASMAYLTIQSTLAQINILLSFKTKSLLLYIFICINKNKYSINKI